MHLCTCAAAHSEDFAGCPPQTGMWQLGLNIKRNAQEKVTRSWNVNGHLLLFFSI